MLSVKMLALHVIRQLELLQEMVSFSDKLSLVESIFLLLLAGIVS